ncbi:YCII-related domain protein [[Clostridium] bifermentans ATCC 19299]|uniref:GTP cyclohydrolase n=1 Tax=Paraclostridium bifermentans TaxID=1490 RepID=A0A5P3XJ24_PARBF|nr:YciI family protein [Paraclostridium bifermentans]EQK39538.1 YCII-related domain protein [[Clostridium] bifermentans ATCC 19299] [Paraclostridium bifermentans ATCC 19299]QEZ70350.1 GTP cyclohydrolase [Paraclostridium bifermentans]
MVIVNITYTVELDKIEQKLEEHIEFLNKYYANNKFICSGRKNPRTGGVILCNAYKEEASEIIKEDPFYINKLGNYEIIEFEASKINKELITTQLENL